MKVLLHLAVAAALAAPCLSSGRVQQSPEVRRNRERWELKSAAERAELQRRFAEFQELSHDHQEVLRKRTRKFEAFETRLREGVPEELRLASGRDERVWREHVEHEVREKGRRMRKKLPRELVEEVESAPPIERPLILSRYHRDHRARAGHGAMERLARACGHSEDEIAGIERVSAEEGVAKMLGYRREQIVATVARIGPPPGITVEEFESLQALPHHGFFERWRALDPPPEWHPWFERPPERGPAKVDREKANLLRQLKRLARPSFEDRYALRGLREADRRETLHERVRERTWAFVEEHGIGDPEARAGLHATPIAAYMEAIRAFVRDREREWGLGSSRRRGGRDGDHDGRERGRRPGERRLGSGRDADR